MITVIARKEALEIVRDGRFRWAAVSVFLLLVAALLSGWAHYDRVAHQRAAAIATERTVWAMQQDKNPHSAAHYGTWAFKPMTPLSMFDYAVTTYTGTALFMEGHKIQDATYRPVDDASGVARLGELTAAVVLQWLIPLLVIFLAFDAFAGERQRGRLRQLMSLGVAPSALTLGKALGLAAPLGAILVPASAIGAAALLLGPSANAPRLANDVASAVRPGPDPAAFAMKKRAIAEESKAGFPERGKAITERLMKESGVEKLDQLSINVPGLNLFETEVSETAAHRALYEELEDAFEAQNTIVQAGALVAPLLAV